MEKLRKLAWKLAWKLARKLARKLETNGGRQPLWHEYLGGMLKSKYFENAVARPDGGPVPSQQGGNGYDLMASEWVSAEEACRLFGISRTSLRRALHRTSGEPAPTPPDDQAPRAA